MSAVKPVPRNDEETPVDDVRRVRRRLSEATDNDINRLAEHARQTTERLRDKLGLRSVSAAGQAEQARGQ
jgi:hypothetical protein